MAFVLALARFPPRRAWDDAEVLWLPLPCSRRPGQSSGPGTPATPVTVIATRTGCGIFAAFPSTAPFGLVLGPG